MGSRLGQGTASQCLDAVHSCSRCRTRYRLTVRPAEGLVELQVSGAMCGQCDPGGGYQPRREYWSLGRSSAVGHGLQPPGLKPDLPALARLDVELRAARPGRGVSLAEQEPARPESPDPESPDPESPDPAREADEGWHGRIARMAAERFGTQTWEIVSRTWTLEHCAFLAQLAEVIDRFRAKVRDGVGAVVRLTVRFVAPADLLAVLMKLLGGLVAGAVDAHFLQPLHGLGQLIRLAGTTCCAGIPRMAGVSGSCPCARAWSAQLSRQVSGELLSEELSRLSLTPLAAVPSGSAGGSASDAAAHPSDQGRPSADQPWWLRPRRLATTRADLPAQCSSFPAQA